MGTPATSCNATSWNAASSEIVGSFDPSTSSLYDNVALAFKNAATNAEGDMCFSPLGRPFWRPTHVGTQNFLPLTEVPSIQVSPVDTIGLTRTVLLLPSGVSRLAL